MAANISDCDPDLLQRLLDGTLAASQETEVAKHVETCADCRHHLESLAADENWWQGTRNALSEPAGSGENGEQLGPNAAVQLRPHERGRSFREELDEPAAPVSMTVPLDFLAPSDNPAMLGRLGEFEILELIGSGGMGIVLKGYDHELNRFIAVKVLHPHCATSAAARRRFTREAQAAAAIVHQHVVAIHAVGANHYPPYLVMSFVPGESLQQRLTRQGPFEVIDVLRIGQQVAEGLAAAHARGLVHRDIKPGNILLQRNVERVLLTDFGLARAADDASLTQSGVIAGTPQFMSPEQTRGDQVDHRTDLFSLGTVLYTLLAGHSPFRAETAMGVLRRVCDDAPRSLQEINPNVPVWLEAFIEKLHAKQPSERFESASLVAELLKNCLSHVEQPVSVPLPEEIQDLIRSRRTDKKIRATPAAMNAIVMWAAMLTVAILVAALAWRPWEQTVPSMPPNRSEDRVDRPLSEALEWDDSFPREAMGIDRSIQRMETESAAAF